MPETKITVRAEDLSSDTLQQIGGGVQQIGAHADESSGRLSNFGRAIEELVPSTETAHDAFSDLKGTLTEMWEHPTAAVGDLVSALGRDLVGGLGAVGVAAAAAAAVIAVAGGAILELGEHATETGAAIERVSLVTGMSVPAVSNLKFAIEAVGGSLDQVNNLMFMFSQRMENSSDKVDTGLKMIGLSLQQIEGMSQDQRLLAISDAFRSADENVNKAAAAMDIFGRQGRDALPLLVKPLSDLVDKSTELGNAWSGPEAQAAEEFELKVKSLDEELSAAWTTLGRDVAPVTQLLSEAWHELKVAGEEGLIWLLKWGTGIGEVKAAYDLFHAAHQVLTGDIEALPDVVGPASDALKKQKEAVDNLRVATHAPGSSASLTAAFDEQARAMSQLNADYQESHQQNVQAEQEAEKLAQSTLNLSLAARGYKGALEDLGQGTVDQIRYELQHKASVEDIARVFGIEKQQIELVKQELKDEEEAAKENAQTHKQLMTELRRIEDEKNANSIEGFHKILNEQSRTTQDQFTNSSQMLGEMKRLDDEYNDHVMRGALSTTQYELLKVDEWKQGVIDKYKATGTFVDQEFYAKVEQRAEQMRVEVLQKHDQLFQDTKHLMNDLLDGPGGWGDTFTQTLVKTGSFKDAFGAVFTSLKNDVIGILGDMLNRIIHDLLDPWIDAFVKPWATRLEQIIIGAVSDKAIANALSGTLEEGMNAAASSDSGHWWDGLVNFFKGLMGGGSPHGGAPGSPSNPPPNVPGEPGYTPPGFEPPPILTNNPPSGPPAPGGPDDPNSGPWYAPYPGMPGTGEPNPPLINHNSKDWLSLFSGGVMSWSNSAVVYAAQHPGESLGPEWDRAAAEADRRGLAHASGGLFDQPHIGRVAEDGPELVGNEGFLTRALRGAMANVGTVGGDGRVLEALNKLNDNVERQRADLSRLHGMLPISIRDAVLVGS